MPDEDEPIPRREGGMPEGGASTLAQRDASAEVSGRDLKPGQRIKGGQDAGIGGRQEEEHGEQVPRRDARQDEPLPSANQGYGRKLGSDENNKSEP